ncbi:MAG: hypothetical protein HYS35_07870 [Betaproteobacteria bacterium]|nr:hypothetical protein [Betaproteobacteria bacterium]
MALVRILACLLAALALNCAAAPFGVRLGTEKIVLDTPPGFSDTGDLASPRLQDLAASLTPASNRILLFALTDADYRRFTQGDRLEWSRYMIAVTPKGLENVRVGVEQFATLVSDALRGLGKPVQTTDVIRFLEKEPEGKAHLLAELKREPTLVSVLQATRLPPVPGETFWQSSRPQYLFFTTTIFLARGRALQISVYLVTENRPDLDWLTSTTERWREELVRLNR